MDEKKNRMFDLATEIAALRNIWMLYKNKFDDHDKKMLLCKYKETYKEMLQLIREGVHRG